MSEKHTPGPWLAERQTVYALDERGEVNRFSCNMQTGYRVHSSFHKVRTDETEMAANARLIAAAPDLLAFAQMILDESDYQYQRDAARVAIAKATTPEPRP